MHSKLLVLLMVALLVNESSAGPVAYGLCQTACNAGFTKCCTFAGGVAGTFTIIGGGAALVACCVVQGTCMAACVPLLAAPTP